jgi:hypothetical protein
MIVVNFYETVSRPVLSKRKFLTIANMTAVFCYYLKTEKNKEADFP